MIIIDSGILRKCVASQNSSRRVEFWGGEGERFSQIEILNKLGQLYQYWAHWKEKSARGVGNRRKTPVVRKRY